MGHLPPLNPQQLRYKGDLESMKPDSSIEPWSVRKLMLAAALVFVTLVNVVYMVHEQNYFATVENEASTLEEAPSGDSKCVKLSKHHVEEAYYREGACFTRAEILSTIKQLILTTAAVFEAHNVTYFLDSGTLLGAFRDEKVIPHDNDADFGIDTRGLEYIRHQPMEFPPDYVFTVWNSTLYPDSPRDEKLPARLVHKNSGLYLDVFAFLDWEGDKVGPLPSWCFFNCAKCPKVSTGGKELKVDRDWIYPLVDCVFEDVMLKCPHRTKKYLEYTFGKGFMKPVAYSYR